jgi:hypothetical protein
MCKSLCVLIATVATSVFVLAAQAPPPGLKSGNPTPGTPQPEPPNLADRVTVIGCVQAVSQAAGQKEIDPGEPSDARFLLNKAERKNVVPPGTGASPLAAAPVPQSLRLRAISSQLTPFVGAHVELSGEILPARDGESGRPPVLQVEFVQKTGEKCQ